MLKIVITIEESNETFNPTNQLLDLVNKETKKIKLAERKVAFEKELTKLTLQTLVNDINEKYNDINIYATEIINSIWVYVRNPKTNETSNAYNVALTITLDGTFEFNDELEITKEPLIYINKKSGGFRATSIVMEDFYELFNLEFAKVKCNVEKLNRVNNLD